MKNKHLLSISIALLSLPLVVSAAPKTTLICPFTDIFTVKGKGVQILESPAPYTLGSLSYEKETDTTFQLGCGDSNVFGGDLYIDVGIDDNNKCSLIIHDGPYTSPTVVPACQGSFKYQGIDSSVSHNFNLNFGR